MVKSSSMSEGRLSAAYCTAQNVSGRTIRPNQDGRTSTLPIQSLKATHITTLPGSDGSTFLVFVPRERPFPQSKSENRASVNDPLLGRAY